MNAITRLVDQHLAAYCHPDAAERLRLIGEVWHPQGRLVDPPLAASGHEGINDQAAMLLGQFPGHRFVRSTAVDEHHGFARYGWKLQDPQGRTTLEGVDVVSFDDGHERIVQVVGFFGAQPQPA
jgi:hypothetical protein